MQSADCVQMPTKLNVEVELQPPIVHSQDKWKLKEDAASFEVMQMEIS